MSDLHGPTDRIMASDSDIEDTQIVVLLATCNGAAHLRPQLESLRNQLRRPTRLIVSDDGSRDDTPAILANFAASDPGFAVEILEGPRRGGAQNFLQLLRAVPRGTDFDDVTAPRRHRCAKVGLR